MLQGLGCRVEDALRLLGFSLNSLGSILGLIKRDTRSLDYGSFGV